MKYCIYLLSFVNHFRNGALTFTSFYLLSWSVSHVIIYPTFESISKLLNVSSIQPHTHLTNHDCSHQTHKEGKAHHIQVFDKCADLMLSLSNLPVPVVAKVNGVAAAAGCQLVASCDIVIATQKSSFSTPGLVHNFFYIRVV